MIAPARKRSAFQYTNRLSMTHRKKLQIQTPGYKVHIPLKTKHNIHRHVQEDASKPHAHGCGL